MGGDPEWRNFTAIDDYYQNGPLPTWIGWYMQHWPHWFHAATAFGTLALELGLVWMMFLPRWFRIVCFCIVTPWQIGIILSIHLLVCCLKSGKVEYLFENADEKIPEIGHRLGAGTQ